MMKTKKFAQCHLIRGVFIKMMLLTFFIIAHITNIWAQINVSGLVTDQAEGTPLIGVNVVIKNSTTGTITGINGNYSITVPDDRSVLVFSYIGYIPYEIEVGINRVINVSLVPDAIQLSEVVVTGLGIERESKALGFAVQQISGSEITGTNEANFLNSLSGRSPGVQITQGNSGVGSSARVVIRGEASLSGDNQPLFILDGIPINNSMNFSVTNSSSSGPQEVDYGNPAGDLNPDDIESVTVLRGANATAIYGSRAANGVILITTKSGKGTKGIGVSVNSATTFESILVTPKWQNEYGQGFQGQFSFVDGNGGGIWDSEDVSWGPRLNGQLIPQFDGPSKGPNGEKLRGADVLARQGSPITPTPWNANPDNVDNFFNTGVTLNNSLALTGANDQGNFRLSYTNLNSKGIIPNVNLNRNTAALNSSYSLTSRLKADASVSYINSSSTNRPGMGYGSENPMYLFAWYGRQVNTESLKEYWQRGFEGLKQFTYNDAWHDNPYFTMYENTNAFDRNRMIGRVALNYRITNDLNLSLRQGLDYSNENRQSRRAYSTQRFPFGMYREDDVYFMERNSDFLLTYTKALTHDWGLIVSAGGNRMYHESNFTSTIANQLSIPNVYTLENSRVPLTANQYKMQKSINSLYGMAQLSFREVIFIDITGREDWSSTLPQDNNSYFYPSVGLSAIISEMTNLPGQISFLKLRGGYAEVGNDTDPYKLRSVYNYGTPYGNNYTAYEDNMLPNSALKPERLKSFEAGMDIRFLKNRIGLDLTYYDTKSENQIIQLPVSGTSGYSSRIVNAGVIRNYGLEGILNLQALRLVNGLNWNLSLNYTLPKSELLSIHENLESYTYAATTVYNTSSAQVYAIAKVGDPIGNIYGTGFQKSTDGQIIFDNGLPVPDNDLRLLGNYNPDFLLGFSNRFSYKNLSLDVLFDWRKGGVVVSRMFSIATTSGNLDHTLEGREGDLIGRGVKNAGTAQNPQYVPNDMQVSAQDYFRRFYHRNHEESSTFDASFIKLRELKLSYTLPASIASNIRVNDVTISAVGKNLFLWTAQKHFDPETITWENDVPVPGVEEMAYPSARSIGFNVSFRF